MTLDVRREMTDKSNKVGPILFRFESAPLTAMSRQRQPFQGRLQIALSVS